jgi:hypothetical protein
MVPLLFRGPRLPPHALLFARHSHYTQSKVTFQAKNLWDMKFLPIFAESFEIFEMHCRKMTAGFAGGHFVVSC